MITKSATMSAAMSDTGTITTELYAAVHLKVFLLSPPGFEVASYQGLQPVPLRIYVQSLTQDFTVEYPTFDLKVDIVGLQNIDFSFAEGEQKLSTTATIPKGTANTAEPTWDAAKPVEGIKLKRVSQQTQKDATLQFQVQKVGEYTLTLVKNPSPNGQAKEVIRVTSQNR